MRSAAQVALESHPKASFQWLAAPALNMDVSIGGIAVAVVTPGDDLYRCVSPVRVTRFTVAGVAEWRARSAAEQGR